MKQDLVRLVVAVALVAAPASAQEQPPLLPVDVARTAIVSCLAAVEAEGQAISSDATEAEWAALRRPSDCIGVASDPCQKDNGYTTYAMAMCVSGEGDAWNALMADWLAEAVDGASEPRRRVIEESQSLWRQEMERSLEIYSVARAEGGGTALGPLSASDALDMTARRALWLRYVSTSL